MWNKPQLMTAVSDLLFVAGSAALLVAAVIWSAHLPWFPVREVAVMNPLKEIRRDELEFALAGHLRGNFFSVDLDEVRQSLEQLPWVRHIAVRRQWPSRIEVSIEEHVPAAYWGQYVGQQAGQLSKLDSGQLVNTFGELFAASMNPQHSPAPTLPMPVLSGPPEMAAEMLGYYQQAETTLKPLGRVPAAVSVSARLAVQLRLDDGVIIELGRQQAEMPLRERLQRFVTYYPSVANAGKNPPSVVDMRYPNGFALRLAAAPVSENKGKP